MATLPWKCEHCGKSNHSYSACDCPISTLNYVDAERAAIKKRLAQLDEIEKAATRRRLADLGVINQ